MALALDDREGEWHAHFRCLAIFCEVSSFSKERLYRIGLSLNRIYVIEGNKKLICNRVGSRQMRRRQQSSVSYRKSVSSSHRDERTIYVHSRIFICNKGEYCHLPSRHYLEERERE
jgi:hypothetical protein